MKTICRITDIHCLKRFNNNIYAKLIDISDNSLIISATLPYIFGQLENKKRDLKCENAENDKKGNWRILI